MLPEDILHLIYQKYFTSEVLPLISKRTALFNDDSTYEYYLEKSCTKITLSIDHLYRGFVEVFSKVEIPMGSIIDITDVPPCVRNMIFKICQVYSRTSFVNMNDGRIYIYINEICVNRLCDHLKYKHFWNYKYGDPSNIVKISTEHVESESFDAFDYFLTSSKLDKPRRVASLYNITSLSDNVR